MFKIQNLTDSASQKQSLVLPDGTIIQITIYYVPLQLGWFITSLIYQDFEVNGLRISNMPNILYQFKNQIPFGLACFSASGREPSQAQDFLSDASELFILDEAEVEEYAEILSGQIQS